MAGIGRGDELNWILDFRPKLIIAVDISNFIFSLEKEKQTENLPILFVKADLCNLIFKSESFNFIFSRGVIQHTRSPELGHRNLWRTLKKKWISKL